MTAPDPRDVPLDPDAAAKLVERDLTARVVSDDGGVDKFLRSVARGFMDEDLTTEQLSGARPAIADQRRMVAVYDADAVDAEMPVGTVDSWRTELTTDVGRGVPMWAISGVTVAPTHRRRGIASALIRGELASAVSAGYAIAGLTVSETTIYGRFGFAPAVNTTSWELTNARAQWVGPQPAGRLDFVDRETLAKDLAELHEKVRLSEPGQVQGWPSLWQRMSGVAPGRENRNVRGVRYTDEAGEVRGIAAYTLRNGSDEWTGNVLNVEHVNADGSDAYAALWRFLLEHDLVRTVRAELRGEDEPLWWMIADQRGATVIARDHEWLRILDVPAALAARGYRSAGSLVLSVEDPLGYATGTWRFTVDADGSASVEATDDPADVTLPITALSAIYVGGVSAVTLAEASLLHGALADAEWLATTFGPLAPPRCTISY